MARYSDEVINDVRQSNDIVDVISQYVHLKRSGRNFFGLCPFHNEKSPSFSVSPDKQIFHCFGCGVGGNVFSFITQIEGINFVEAVQSKHTITNFTRQWRFTKRRTKGKSIQSKRIYSRVLSSKLI